ncbi:hypothetical protein CAPTEDRAFT_207504 [Capitella teleta]|uniref:Uncharacterized protein n=1 Tax=Capitella teleta TaxID=283909 RepID=R7U2R7_CAPTE|nr:hypothetical protein CAPTEDRAFT_207504 [Capitella teleta]|eukprot:ELU00640.1 hypothetical protein CAPTEDRAFT_207504 [Capitella teleta]
MTIGDTEGSRQYGRNVAVCARHGGKQYSERAQDRRKTQAWILVWLIASKRGDQVPNLGGADMCSSFRQDRKDIISARNTLWESVQRDEMPKVSRRQNVTSEKGSMLTIMDIISAIRVLYEAETLPCFRVDALNLHRIPSTTPSETSSISICERLAKPETRMKESEDVIAGACFSFNFNLDRDVRTREILGPGMRCIIICLYIWTYY